MKSDRLSVGRARPVCIARIAAIAFAILVMAVPTFADYQSGLDAYEKGDYEVALDQWLKLATSPPESVNPAIYAETCYAIAMLFWIGQGVPQDSSVAAGWLQKAADLNHVGAETKLGFLFASGQGVPQSDYEAYKYFQMAANQGDPDAQYNLGVLYREGLGVEANGTEALKWFREAASNGDQQSSSIVAQYDAGMRIGSVTPPLPSNSSNSSNVNEPPVGTDVPLTPELSEADPVGDLGEGWISMQDPEHYTIQVIALLQQEKLLQFINGNPDWGPFAIYVQQWNSKPLYVLLQGNYASLDQARQAVRKFPTSIQQRDKLWIRRFLMVQSILK